MFGEIKFKFGEVVFVGMGRGGEEKMSFFFDVGKMFIEGRGEFLLL